MSFITLTDQDKRTIAYRGCIAAWTVVGIATGSFAGQPLIGAIGGVAWGLLTCHAVPPSVVDKLLSSGSRLTDSEVMYGLEYLHSRYPSMNKQQLISTFAQVRYEIARQPGAYCRAG